MIAISCRFTGTLISGLMNFKRSINDYLQACKSQLLFIRVASCSVFLSSMAGGESLMQLHPNLPVYTAATGNRFGNSHLDF